MLADLKTISRTKLQLHPVNWVQRIALYVTESRYYLVGSNNTQTAFKVLKIDRECNELAFVDDRVEYNYQEIRDLLLRIDHGNPSGLKKSVSSFGLLGFVRFLHGYYLILIIKRRKIAAIGYHTVYKVEETKLVYIPSKQPTELVNEESRYVRAFNSIDLTSNFYFSYSYDITHSLQYNLSPIRKTKFLQYDSENKNDLNHNKNRTDGESRIILVKSKPNYRFVWNSHLIDFEGLHDDWKLYLMHGFVSQANLCVYSKPIYITLIARRSRYYSGTRFLKRGLNLDGAVANEVETEQIVHDSSVSDFSQGYFTSFVQLRGSLPDRWSQDSTKIIPKPQITQDFVDPYHEATSKHFNDLLRRYGTPLVVLNLVKQTEKKPHETILSEMLKTSVEYLNQFLPQQHVIRLIGFDMSRCSKSTNENVMQRLGKIGFNIVRVTGIFQSWRSARKSNYDSTYNLHLRQRSFSRKPSSSRIGGYRLTNGQCLQNGIVRVNCVDSLDRTNTAQFVLGKIALAFQLQALGVLIEPKLEYDTDAVRLLEQLYEDHGDTIALQYGGSQLVHRVKTYRKVAPITSHSGEIMQTLSRYYSNTFSDSDKQNIINIFLGVRRPQRDLNKGIFRDINQLINDYYLHNQLLMVPFDMKKRSKSYTQWWDRELLKSLPRAYYEYEKELTSYALEIFDGTSSKTLIQRVDYFMDAYRPYEVTHLVTSFPNQILHTIKDLMPNGAINYSPFCLRLEPGKLREKYMNLPPNKRPPSNPSLFGLPSTDSNASDSSILESDSEDSDFEDLSTHPTAKNTSMLLKRSSFLRELNMNVSETTLTVIPEINEADEQERSDNIKLTCSSDDMQMYKTYVSLPVNLDDSCHSSQYENLINQTIISTTHLIGGLAIEPDESKLKRALELPCIIPPNEEDLSIYRHYVDFVSVQPAH